MIAKNTTIFPPQPGPTSRRHCPRAMPNVRWKPGLWCHGSKEPEFPDFHLDCHWPENKVSFYLSPTSMFSKVSDWGDKGWLSVHAVSPKRWIPRGKQPARAPATLCGRQQERQAFHLIWWGEGEQCREGHGSLSPLRG